MSRRLLWFIKVPKVIKFLVKGSTFMTAIDHIKYRHRLYMLAFLECTHFSGAIYFFPVLILMSFCGALSRSKQLLLGPHARIIPGVWISTKKKKKIIFLFKFSSTLCFNAIKPIFFHTESDVFLSFEREIFFMYSSVVENEWIQLETSLLYSTIYH